MGLRRPMRSPPSSAPTASAERGAIVGLLAIAVTISGAVALAALTITGLSTSHTRASNAADLTAVTVAARLFDSDDPCAAGTVIARANDAELVACELQGPAGVVTVAVRLPDWLARASGRDTITARARAEVVIHPEPRPEP